VRGAIKPILLVTIAIVFAILVIRIRSAFGA